MTDPMSNVERPTIWSSTSNPFQNDPKKVKTIFGAEKQYSEIEFGMANVSGRQNIL